jgi:hypothetical protein
MRGVRHASFERVSGGRGLDQVLDPVPVLLSGMDQHIEAVVVGVSLKLDAVSRKSAGHQALDGLIGGPAR